MFNLLSILPEEDKEKLLNYIDLYGIPRESYIGHDAWLKHWGKNKIKLYKLLNNSLTYSFSIDYKMDETELLSKIKGVMDRPVGEFFYRQWREFCDKIINYLEKEEENYNWAIDAKHILTPSVLLDGEINFPIKYKNEKLNKTLNLQKTTKPIRAIQKIINFFAPIINYVNTNKLKDSFEHFTQLLSTFTNIKNEKLEIFLSIHPLDFLTMSDNASGWNSCMSWTEDGYTVTEGGCYRIGTVEMMNSNNVLIAYIRGTSDYNFSINPCNKNTKAPPISHKDNPTYFWNNKRWRQLVVLTPDIILAGKAYPYQNYKLTKIIINELRSLALKNLHYSYKFGIEKYYDMNFINNAHGLYKIRNELHNTNHQAILFDTKAMYNDFLNSNNEDSRKVNFQCVRNKVKHTKIISISGAANCLCCNQPVPKLNNRTHDYNSRYNNTGKIICRSCIDDHYCTSCKTFYFDKSVHLIKRRHNMKLQLCEDCYKKYVRICPECGSLMYLTRTEIYHIKDESKKITELDLHVSHFEPLKDTQNAIPLYLCDDCIKKHIYNDLYATRTTQFGIKILAFSPEVEWEKYQFKNLKTVDKVDPQIKLHETIQ